MTSSTEPASSEAALMASVGSNRLLSMLSSMMPSAEFAVLMQSLQSLELRLGAVLHEGGHAIETVYFPTTATISLISVLQRGSSVELASVGNEGFVGVAVVLGGESMPASAVVRTAGFAYRLPASVLRQAFKDSKPIRQWMLRYAQVLMTQVSQTAVCNRCHTIEQQLCRWLLTMLDRQQGNELVVTQELVAATLGVRREGITEAAGRLQRAGIIQYRRGHISVIDRKGLQSRSCECHAVVRNEMNRLLTPPAIR